MTKASGLSQLHYSIAKIHYFLYGEEKKKKKDIQESLSLRSILNYPSNDK